jgi:hypothetical protein
MSISLDGFVAGPGASTPLRPGNTGGGGGGKAATAPVLQQLLRDFWPPGRRGCDCRRRRMSPGTGGDAQEMNILHRHPTSAAKHDETGDALTTADYDAQVDLALPPHDAPNPGGFAPYAGELVQQDNHPGYDLERDIGS